VPAQSVRRVTLELEPGETIHGSLHDDSGARQRFHGWLELSAALERAWERTAADLGENAGAVPPPAGGSA
jgi:hypothetical protein